MPLDLEQAARSLIARRQRQAAARTQEASPPRFAYVAPAPPAKRKYASPPRPAYITREPPVRHPVRTAYHEPAPPATRPPPNLLVPTAPSTAPPWAARQAYRVAQPPTGPPPRGALQRDRPMVAAPPSVPPPRATQRASRPSGPPRTAQPPSGPPPRDAFLRAAAARMPGEAGNAVRPTKGPLRPQPKTSRRPQPTPTPPDRLERTQPRTPPRESRQSPWTKGKSESTPVAHARPGPAFKRVRQTPHSNSTAWQPQVSPVQFPKDILMQVTLRDDLEGPEFLEGFPADGLAFSIEGKKVNLCTQADDILGIFFDDDPEKSIEYSEQNNQVNDSWERLPEVGEALRDRVPDVGECFCIAKSDAHQLWAVGVSDKGRNRYQASRIALAAVLVSKSLDAGEDVDMAACQSFAAIVDAYRGVRSEEAPAQPPQKKRKTTVSEVQKPQASEIAEPVPAEPISTLPRDVPLVISFANGEHPMPSGLEGLSESAIVVSSDGKKKAFYSNADKLLTHIAGEQAADVEYHDDDHWSVFPEIGSLLKEIAEAEECFCVAVSRDHDLWAVGVGMRAQNRTSAAKIALATALAVNAQDAGDPIDLSEFPQFEEFVQQAYSEILPER